MIINVASFGYFGHFLAREMQDLGYLGLFYTNLPASRAYGISKKHLRSNPITAAPYVAGKIGMHRLARYLNWSSIELFDRWVASQMTSCDIFHCFSAFGRKAHQVARDKYGAMTVVERGSSHIGFQDDILREEYGRWGISYPGIDPRVIEKEQYEYNECDYITVQSSFAERTFIARGISAQKLVKLPLGVDLNMFHPVPKEDNVFRVLYAGTISLRKGSLYLLAALQDLRLNNFEFMFNGHVSDEIKNLILPYANCIRSVGTRPFDQLYKLYSQASVFVLPTIEDGFAKVITEAMACGVPVIATTNCGAEDVLTDGKEGFIVPIRDPEAIREKIEFLYENPDFRDQMAAAALDKAKTLLSLSSHGTRAFEAYSTRYKQFQHQFQEILSQ